MKMRVVALLGLPHVPLPLLPVTIIFAFPRSGALLLPSMLLIPCCIQGPENSTVTIVLERDGATFSAEGRRIKS